jgi:hypothetical protein
MLCTTSATWWQVSPPSAESRKTRSRLAADRRARFEDARHDVRVAESLNRMVAVAWYPDGPRSLPARERAS